MHVIRPLRPLALVPVLLALLLPSGVFGAPTVVRTLPGKITLVTREVRTRPIVSLQAWVRAGGRDESDQDRGVAMAIAQQLFAGARNFKEGELEKDLAAIGGSVFGEAMYGYSVYGVTVPARSVDRAVDALSEALLRPRLDARFLDQGTAKARRAVRDPLYNPEAHAMNTARATLWQGTPLAAPFAVPEIEIGALTLPILERFYRQHYVAEKLVIVATGDVDSEALAGRIERAFAEMPHGKPAAVKPAAAGALAGPRVIVQRNPEEVSAFSLTVGFRAPAAGTADALALDVLLALLVDSPASRLHRRGTGEGTEFTDQVADRGFEAEGGTIGISLRVIPERLLDAESALLGEIERVKNAPIDAGEFQTAVQTVLARELFAQAELEGLGRAAALAVCQVRSGADEVIEARLRALKPEDLVAVARKHLDPRNAVVVEQGVDTLLTRLGAYASPETRIREKWTLAASTFGGGPKVVASADGERRSRLDAPLARIPAAPVESGRGRVERVVLPGGLRVLISEDWSAPVATIGAFMLGGVRCETEANNGITALVRETLMNVDNPGHPGETYRQSLLRLGRLVPYQDRDMWGYSLSLPAASAGDALGVLAGMLAGAPADTVTVDASRISVMTALDTWRRDDAAQRARLIFPTKYQVSGYRLPGLGTRRNLAAIPHAEIEEYHRKFVVRQNVVVTVFGAVRAADAKVWVERAFRDLPGRPFDPGPVAKEGEITGEFREKWELGAGPRSSVSLAFNGPPASSPDIPVMYVINSLLSGPRGWFEKHVLSTGAVLSANSVVSHAIDESPIIASMETDGMSREEEGVRLLLRQFKKVALLPLEGEELGQDFRNAKAHAVGSYLRAGSSNTSRAFQWARADLFGLGPEYVLTLAAKMDAVTHQDLLRVGLKYFQKDDFVRQPYAVCETRPGGW